MALQGPPKTGLAGRAQQGLQKQVLGEFLGPCRAHQKHLFVPCRALKKAFGVLQGLSKQVLGPKLWGLAVPTKEIVGALQGPQKEAFGILQGLPKQVLGPCKAPCFCLFPCKGTCRQGGKRDKLLFQHRPHAAAGGGAGPAKVRGELSL